MWQRLRDNAVTTTVTTRGSAFLALLVGLVVSVGANGADADKPESVSRIGYLGTTSRADNANWLRALRQRLKALGRSHVIEERWADGKIDRLLALTKELVASDVDVIVTTGTPGAMAAKNGTSTIPIVAVGMADPVRIGLIQSLSHPGGNLTGISLGYGPEFTGKWLEMLQETVPHLASLAVIANPQSPVLRVLRNDLEALAPRRNVRVHFLPVTQSTSLDDAFKQAQRKAQAALLLGDPVTMSNRSKIASLAIANRLPVMYNVGDFVEDGGLMSYAPDVESQVQRAAEYVDKILRGAAPGELPVEQPTKYQLTLNLKVAKSIGLGFPESMLLRADRVLH